MSFLTNLYAKVVAKLGSLGRFLGIIADEVDIALSENDAAKLRAASAKAREKANDLLALCDVLDEAAADNKLTLTEGSEIALKLEALVD
jgi:hypothetical protein